jgi:hypothetical protein
MSFFNDVVSFFGGGDGKSDRQRKEEAEQQQHQRDMQQREDYLAAKQDIEVQRAEQDVQIGEQQLAKLEKQEREAYQTADGAITDDWLKQNKQAKEGLEAAKVAYSRFKEQDPDGKNRDKEAALYEKQRAAQAKADDPALQNLHAFKQKNPIENYLKPSEKALRKEIEQARAYLTDARKRLSAVTNAAMSRAKAARGSN